MLFSCQGCNRRLGGPWPGLARPLGRASDQAGQGITRLWSAWPQRAPDRPEDWLGAAGCLSLRCRAGPHRPRFL